MRKYGPGEAPRGVQNLASPCGRKVRIDKKDQFVCRTPQGRTHAETPSVAGGTDNQQKKRRQASFKAQLKDQPWRSHQSISMKVKQGSYCMYEHCRAGVITIFLGKPTDTSMSFLAGLT